MLSGIAAPLYDRPPSIYADDVTWPPAGSPAEGDSKVDIAILGGGLTGISTALNLAERGHAVHLYEAGRLGHGGSGRNGGQICQGWSGDFEAIASQLPAKQRAMAWQAGLQGRELIIERCRRHKIDADLRFGYVHAALHQHQLNALRQMQRDWQAEGYDGLELLEGRAAVRQHIGTDAYTGGLYDAHSGHLNPLKYLLGLARAALQAGVVIHEHTPIRRIDPAAAGGAPKLYHDRGCVTARRIVLCGNAYLGAFLHASGGQRPPAVMHQRLAPVTSGILATRPLGDNLIRQLIPGRIAIADCNTALNYYRIDAAGRMLFGGRASYTAQENSDISRDLKRRMTAVFPELETAETELAWSGRIGITVSRIPHFGRIGDACLFAQGFSGHGVAFTGVAGAVLAEAIDGDSSRFDAFAGIHHLPFPGGPLRTPALALGMAFYKCRDWVLQRVSS